MSHHAKLTSKGQITVPLRVRTMLGVKTGDRITFEKVGENVVVRPLKASSPFEKYRGIFASDKPKTRAEFIEEFREFRGREEE